MQLVEVMDPRGVEYVPWVQRVQLEVADAPTPLEYVPAWQSAQITVPEPEAYVPLLHDLQSVDPRLPVYKPGGQRVQLPNAGAPTIEE